MSKHWKSHIQLHLVVLIFGFTAILGKLIDLPALPLVWYRITIALATLLLVFIAQNKLKQLILPKLVVLKFLGVGFIVAAHWLCFFHAIKVSNVSVTLGCLAANTLFTSIMEPLSQKRKPSIVDMIIGIIIIIGLYMIFQFETKYTLGIIFALLAAWLSGVFTVINKNNTHKYNFSVLTFYEMLGGLMGVTLFMLFTGNISSIAPNLLKSSDIIWLILLGTVCTAYAFGATIDVMKVLSAFYVILAVNLEPVYGIILAFFIFGQSEMMTLGFYIGTIVILATVFSYPFIKRLFSNQSSIPY